MLLNAVILYTSAYNYEKTVLSAENLTTPSCLGAHYGPGYVKSFRINRKKCFFLLASLTCAAY